MNRRMRYVAHGYPKPVFRPGQAVTVAAVIVGIVGFVLVIAPPLLAAEWIWKKARKLWRKKS